MTAFNTSTNTGSTTFTNSWGTISLLPSASPQHVSGFARTDGWRYLEFYINDAGGDNGTVFMGLRDPVSTVLYGGANERSVFVSGALATPYTAVGGTASLTVETGDVFMFAIDMTGSGRNHSGASMFATTISSGTGITLTPVYIEIGKNGVWPGVGVNTFAYPTGGYPLSGTPFVVRDSTSASSAMVSLRVVTASFAYTIPTGMIAWGDGPSGGGSITADADIKWDVTKVSTDPVVSLSGSDYYMVVSNTSSFGRHNFVHSTLLPTTGKRIVEFHFGKSSGSLDATNEWVFGFGDASTSVTDTLETSTQKYGINNVTRKLWRRSTDMSASVSDIFSPALGSSDQPSVQFFMDFDSSRYWIAGGNQGGFISDKGAGVATPYEGVAGLTFTSSVGLRMFAELRGDYFTAPASNYMFINVGQQSFRTYPLLPGWKSMNGNREVLGTDTTWNTTLATASMSFEADNLVCRPNCQAILMGSTTKHSGKYYFEVFRTEGSAGTASMSYAVGIRPATASTITAALANLLDTGIYFDNQRGKASRYGVTTVWTGTYITTGTGSARQWQGIAVDFDTGKVWGGTRNHATGAMNWGSGDPAAGTGAHFTFTASTTMNIAVLTGDINSDIVLIAEDGNLANTPTGFDPWGGTSVRASTTSTPSGTTGSNRVLWPYGVMT